MDEPLISILSGQLRRARDRMRPRLEGLNDTEYFWEPVPGCWTVRRRRPGEETPFDGRGEWVYDYALPEPDPPPFTTIAWRLDHIAGINDMYYEHVFGPGLRDYEDQEVAHTAGDAIAWWEAGIERFHEAVTSSTDRDLARIVSAPWGDTRSVRDWIVVLVHETVHHGAEIACLRDLYRALGRDEDGPRR